MSSLVKGLFGDKEQTTTQQRLPPLNVNTTTGGGSSLNSNQSGGTQNTRVNLNPNIATNRNQVRTGFESLLDRVQGENSSFVQAAINPLIERLAPLVGNLQQSLGRRNVRGSIGDQQIRNARTDVARTINDQRLKAEQQGISNTGSILTNLRGLNQDELQQELSSLGLSQNTVNSVISSQLPSGQTTTSPNDGSGLGNLLFAASMASDINVKENIEYVGELNGHGIYDFNYKGGSKRYRGVMAQLVEKITPDAVTTINGIKHVFYDKIGLKMVELNA